MLGKIVRNRVPRRTRIDVGVKLRPDPGIIIECAHANGNLRAIRPFAAKQTRAACHAKRLHCPFALPVNADQFLAFEQVELFF